MSTTATVKTIPLLGNLHKDVTEAESRNSEAFLAAMQLDYTVKKVPAMVGEGFGRDNPEQVPNQFHLLRDIDGMVDPDGIENGRILSPHTVTDVYYPLTPRDMTGVLDYFVSEGWGHYVGAWQSHGGSHEIIAVRMNLQTPVPGDTGNMHYYLIARNRHASGSIQFSGCAYRPWCCNMFGRIFDVGMRFKHTTNVNTRLDFAGNVYKRTVKKIDAQVARLGELTKHSLAQHGGAERVIDIVLDIDRAGKVTAQQQTKSDDLLQRLNRPDLGIFGRNLYDVFQAVTNQTSTWDYGLRGDKGSLQLVDSILGSRGDFEGKAFTQLCKLAGV